MTNDERIYGKKVIDSINRGIADAENGRTYSTEEVKAALTARTSKGNPGDGDQPRLCFLPIFFRGPDSRPSKTNEFKI